MSGVEQEAASTVMSAAHLVYIPLCVLAGIILGWILGGRSARDEIRRLRRLVEEQDQREAERRSAKKNVEKPDDKDRR